MKKALLVIDMQHDFVDGALGSEAAQKIVMPVRKRVEEYLANGDRVYYTQDTHHENYMQTNEGKHLPIPHCVFQTPGWEIVNDAYVKGTPIILKETFGTFSWKALYDIADEIELVGLCTDICVLSNAIILKAQFPEKRIVVNLNCTAATTPEAFNASLEIFKSCQIETINE
mgnify:FL=1